MRTPSAEPCVWMCGARCRVPVVGVLLAAFIGALAGCGSTPQPDPPDAPPIAVERGEAAATEVVGVIRRAEVPRSQPIDRAWALIDEQVLNPVTLGVWHGNGLRIGRMRRDQLDAFASEMPNPIARGTTTINQSSQPTPILESPALPGSLRLEVDMTRPPYPRHAERIAGGNNSTLRLLARIETLEDGGHQLVLTPHHYDPSPFDLLPRDPFEKQLDGRVFDELAVRLPIGPDQIAVVGLYWPWPEAPQGAEQGQRASRQDASTGQTRPDRQPDDADNPAPPAGPQPLPPAEPGDPAAPPPHLQSEDTGEPPADPPDNPTTDQPTARDQQDAPQHTAPPLTTTFGSRLFATKRVRIPVQTVLLITIEKPGGP